MSTLIMHQATLTIDCIVTQTAEHTRPVDLGSQVLCTCGRMSSTAIDCRLLATLDYMQNIGNQILLVKMGKRRENPRRVTRRCQKGRIELRLDTTLFKRLLLQPALYIDTTFITRLLHRLLLVRRTIFNRRLHIRRQFVLGTMPTIFMQNEAPHTNIRCGCLVDVFTSTACSR